MTKINPYQKTPCVGRCSTVYGDPICRGCKRFINEVSFWNQLQIEQKTAIWQRLERLADRIIPQFVEILDTAQLKKFLEHHAIRYPAHLSATSWALHCIENFPVDIQKISQAGMNLKIPEITTTKELKLALQKAIYTLSLAEKERHAQHGLI